MLDVLGFADRIQTRHGLEQTTAQYAALIADAKTRVFPEEGVPKTPKPEPNFEFGQFVFDSLVLVSYPIEPKSVYRFFSATILLMELFFAKRFPLRGAVTKGDFSVDQAAAIFLSDTFKRLRSEEMQQQWSGCSLLEDIEDLALQSLMGLSREVAATTELSRSSPLHRVPVPLKGSKSVPVLRWCLNWSHFVSPKALAAGLSYMEADPAKRKNTLAYLELIQSLVDDTQTLVPEFSPARSVKVMKFRSGFRMKFEDEEGNPVNPQGTVKIEVRR